MATEMDFQNVLLKVGKALSKDEVKALVFLCTDLLGKKPNSVESASELFSCLMKQDCLSPENPQLLTELLLTIERRALVRDLGLSLCTTMSLISPYRKLLYSLSEDITDSELREVKFLLNTMVSRRKLEEHISTLEVFLEMERMDHLSESDLKNLESIIGEVCPMLNDKISQFKALRVPNNTQERSQPKSLSYPFEPKQGNCQSLVRSGPFGKPGSSYGGNKHETLSHELMGTDAISSEENKASSETLMSQTTSINAEGLGTYLMTSEKRGICLIVNNYDFSKSTVALKQREGTDADQKFLQSVFQWLGFELDIHRDCDGNKMLSVFRELSTKDHSRMDCVVCCVLSHGVEGSIYGVDGSLVKISDLTEPFNGLKCSTLAGKPKLFFIQACQGTKEQNAVYIESDSPAYSFLCSDAVVAKDGIPSSADFLLGMATVPSFVSFRQKTNGTWFIQSLCQNLVQMVPSECDLMSILTKVNADVSQKSDFTGQRKQMPQPAFSLRKKVVFPVPKVPYPSL